MFQLRAVLLLLLAGASLAAQMPLSATGYEVREVAVSATATPQMLSVTLTIEDGWHAYSRDVGGGNPVKIELAKDCDFVAAGELRLPEAHDGKVAGTATWQLPIQGRGAGDDLRAVVWFQICDELECHAPKRVQLAGNPQPASVLVVVDEIDDRSRRLDAFLAKNGFDVAVAIYDGGLTSAFLDQHDLVLADSKLFGKGKRVRKQVLAFPKTTTPIVAVGFYGTELIEAHGVAMTSGYI